MGPEEKTCETCKHFYRHYIHWSGKQYRPLDVGHCGDPRARYKTIHTSACWRYKGREKAAG